MVYEWRGRRTEGSEMETPDTTQIKFYSYINQNLNKMQKLTHKNGAYQKTKTNRETKASHILTTGSHVHFTQSTHLIRVTMSWFDSMQIRVKISHLICFGSFRSANPCCSCCRSFFFMFGQKRILARIKWMNNNNNNKTNTLYKIIENDLWKAFTSYKQQIKGPNDSTNTINW